MVMGQWWLVCVVGMATEAVPGKKRVGRLWQIGVCDSWC
jgi:hypothetical protein